MSAERLREAAALMRSRAEASLREDGAPKWESIGTLDPDNDGWIVAHSPSDADYDTTIARCVFDFNGRVSAHIASWHPLVALAVADWLLQMDALGPDFESVGYFHALVVADAYLGSAT